MASTLENGLNEESEDRSIVYTVPYEFQEFSYWTVDSYSGVLWTDAINAGLLKRSIIDHREFIPDLAESMPTANADATVFTIKLKQDLVFNTGNPITAEDVVFSYKIHRTSSIDMDIDVELSLITETGVVALDDYTVEFTLREKNGLANEIFSYPIVDQDYFQTYFDECTSGGNCDWNDVAYANGTAGAFEFESYDAVNKTITVVKNPNYWYAGNVWADKITFKYILSKFSAISELEAGTADILDAEFGFDSDDIPPTTGKSSYMTELSHAEMNLNHLNPYYGTGESVPDTGEITDDAEQARLMRKAISHIIDRQYIANDIQGQAAMPASLPMPQPVIGWRDDLAVDEYNIDLAKQIMESIGFNYADLGTPDADGAYSDSFFDIVVTVPNSVQERVDWASLIAASLPKIGIGVSDFQSLPWSIIIPRTFGYSGGTLVPSYAEGGFDMTFLNLESKFNWDPTGLYDESGLADMGSGYNFYNFINTTVSDKVLEYTSEYNTDNRIKLLGELQEMLHYNRPVLPLTYSQGHWAYASDIQGLDGVMINKGSFEWGNLRKTGWSEPPGYVTPAPYENPEPPSDTSDTNEPPTTGDSINSPGLDLPISGLWFVPFVLIPVLRRRQ